MSFHDELNSLYRKATTATEHERAVVLEATRAILIDLARKGVDKVSEEDLKHGVMYHDETGKVRTSAFEDAFSHAISALKDEGLRFVAHTESDNFYFWEVGKNTIGGEIALVLSGIIILMLLTLYFT